MRKSSATTSRPARRERAVEEGVGTCGRSSARRRRERRPAPARGRAHGPGGRRARAAGLRLRLRVGQVLVNHLVRHAHARQCTMRGGEEAAHGARDRQRPAPVRVPRALAEHVDPGFERRGDPLRGRPARPRARDVARARARRGRRVAAGRDGCDRRAASPRARRAARRAVRYDELLPRDYWEPAARLARLAELGVDEAVLFPNYGLGIERTLSVRSARRCARTSAPGTAGARASRPRGAGACIRSRISRCAIPPGSSASSRRSAARACARAMIAPALVDGKPLSHPDLERAWAAFVHHGVSPVFHVADQPRVFDDAWYTRAARHGRTSRSTRSSCTCRRRSRPPT